MPTSHIVIPARLHSTRLPRKLLLRETGKSVLQHTYEAAMRAELPSAVTVATDHLEIAADVARFGGGCVMTDPNAASGTDRVAEVARELPEVDIIVNVQGDEPEIDPDDIDAVVRMLQADSAAQMATLATPIRTRQQLLDSACVKVVFNTQGRAMYFSRSPIPAVRDWNEELLSAQPPHFFQHVGLYAYRQEFLLQLAGMPRCEIEKLESLEQLRVLNAGVHIVVGVTHRPSIGIDTLDDYAAFVARRKPG